MNEEFCEHCGASLKKYWYRITPGLVDVLIVILEQIRVKNQNSVNMKELRDHLKPFQYTQSTKLRFHGLIAKDKVNGKWNGHWLITKRGGEFLRGEISIPQKVQTFRNRVIDHDDITVTFRELMGADPYLETFRDLDYGVKYQEATQGSLFV